VTDRDSEIEKYVTAYGSPGYKMGRKRRSFTESSFAEMVRDCGPCTYLDVGCGRGEMLRYASSLGLDAYGTEIVPSLLVPGRVKHAYAHSLPFEDDSFDYVTSFDVMEHLVPGDDKLALEEMRRVARKGVMVSLSNLPSRCKLTGANLHINIRSYSSWNRLICDIFAGWDVEWLNEGEPEPPSPTWRMTW